MSTQANKNKGGIPDEKLKDLKDKYPHLKCGSIENLKKPGERLYFYYTPPTQDQWNKGMSLIMDKEIAKSKIQFHTHCIRWQQPEIETNGYFEENILAIGKLIGDKYKIPEAVDEDF